MNNDESRAPLLECHQITRVFPGVVALDEVDLTVCPGEVLAVLGEHGAAKSTLMKILAGVQQPSGGRIVFDGRPLEIDGVRAATELGIILIHQELNLSDNLSVAANISLGREPHVGGLLRQRTIRETAQKVLRQLGLDVDPETLVRDLPIGQQQLVEIARALSVDARLLIMDEPTSSLSQKETETLFGVVRKLRADGISVVYITHRLSEVKELADRVTVLRDGKNAGEIPRDEITHDRMVRLMVGRDLSSFYSRTAHEPGEPVLEARNLRTPVHPTHALNFAIRAGEVVGIAGLVGAGRTELLECLFGEQPAVGGTILIRGREQSLRSSKAAVGSGLALVPEDRKQQGLILEMCVRENCSLASLNRDSFGPGLIDRKKEHAEAEAAIARLSIRTPSAEQTVQLLSGGNQQKVVLAKWLALNPALLMLDEPTRGIDVGAKQEIYGLMDRLAGQGMAVLFVSSEMEEILGVADRILVMHEGRISGELQREEFSEEAVMQLATGAGRTVAVAAGGLN